MSFNEKDNKNLLLNKIIKNGDDEFKINEFVPTFSNDASDVKFFTYDEEIQWSSIKGSDNLSVTKNGNGDIIIDVSIAPFPEITDVYFRDGQIGIGGLPIHTYKVDIRVPENTRTTALHIGDGVYGFSMGNATTEGFLPQIVGIGSDADDAGFYILGKASLDTSSKIPAIIFDGRNLDDSPLDYRPILGISSGSYSDYKFLIDAHGRVGIGKIPEIYKLEVDGNIRANNIIFDTSTGVSDLRKEIEDLKARIKDLELK